MTLHLDSYFFNSLIIFSKATGPVLTKFRVKPPGEIKFCSIGPGHMTNMVAIPVHCKTFTCVSRTNGLMALKPGL